MTSVRNPQEQTRLVRVDGHRDRDRFIEVVVNRTHHRVAGLLQSVNPGVSAMQLSDTDTVCDTTCGTSTRSPLLPGPT